MTLKTTCEAAGPVNWTDEKSKVKLPLKKAPKTSPLFSDRHNFSLGENITLAASELKFLIISTTNARYTSLSQKDPVRAYNVYLVVQLLVLPIEVVHIVVVFSSPW